MPASAIMSKCICRGGVSLITKNNDEDNIII